MLWIVLALVLGSCTSTHVVSSWHNGVTAPQQYRRILVLALADSAHRPLLDRIAGHMAGDLTDLGYDAVPVVSTHFTDTLAVMKSEAEALKLFRRHEVDAVLTLVLLTHTQAHGFIPGWLYAPPHSVYGNSFWAYYYAVKDGVPNPGYYEVTTNYYWENNLFDLRSQKLLYTLHTESGELRSAERFAHRFSKMVMGQMRKDSIVTRQREP